MTDWYEESFGEDYLLVYKHRDAKGAKVEVHNMIRWLQLAKGSRVLDLCCGMGRHSLALAECGFRVTGMDLSSVLLQEARRRDTGRKITWVEGDMRQVPLEGPYHAVVNLFTSFGYFDDDEQNEAVFHEIHRLLEPGGRFIVDFLNPDHVARHLVPESVRTEGAVTIRENRIIENGFVRKTITLEETGKPPRHYTEQVKLYRLKDFRAFAGKSGLRLDCIYGGYNGEPYHENESPRIILVGSRKESSSS
ncbi:methyltransferase domain-containing protein [Paenibacillus sp. CC-CFT747]|nr:methyltransferase domain-containing protein [Paenibacillus sp. CC-CFT747]